MFQHRNSEPHYAKAGGVFCGNILTPALWSIIQDIQYRLTWKKKKKRMDLGLPAHGCSYVNAWDETCWCNVWFSWSRDGYDYRIHMFFQKWLLTAHLQMSGIGCCLPSKPVVGDLAVSQVHMVASFLPSWSCQSHILLSAAPVTQNSFDNPSRLWSRSSAFNNYAIQAISIVDKERTKWNLRSEPSCTHNRGFLQPNPNGALQTLVDSTSQKIFSTGDNAVLVYNPSGSTQKETRQMRRNMWDTARGGRHKNWP